MSYVCKICIAMNGLAASELRTSQFATEEEMYQHIEKEHHIPVRRAGETKMACMSRMKRENPDAGGPFCRCPVCTGQMGIVKMINLMSEIAPPNEND